jgi:hypothetical protein
MAEEIIWARRPIFGVDLDAMAKAGNARLSSDKHTGLGEEGRGWITISPPVYELSKEVQLSTPKEARLSRLNQAWDILCNPWSILSAMVALGAIVIYATVQIHNHLVG